MYSHLIRRGIEAATHHLSKEEALEWQANEFARLHPHYQMPPWGVAIVAVTTIGFVLLCLSLEYTIRLVMVNLAIIETPSNAVVKVYKPISEFDDKKGGVVDVEVEETHIISEKPITNSIRRTLQELSKVGGYSARWRGLPIFLVYILVISVIHLLVMPIRQAHRISVIGPLADLAAALLAARIHCAWTHATITTGSKRYSERVVSRAQWKQLLAPTALKIATQELSAVAMFLTTQLTAALMERQASTGARAALALIPVLVALALWLFALLPASIILVRKEASMLPESEDTVVPFDRSFGNRVVPGLRTPSIREAWASVSAEVWRRVVMLHLKWAGILAVLAVFYVHVALLEVWAIMGDALPTLLMSVRARLQTLGVWAS